MIIDRGSEAAFVVGVNYPWLECGHDYGPRPPAWAGTGPHDWDRLARDLDELRALGASVTRLFVLAGGVNYPVGEAVDAVAQLDSARTHRRRLVLRDGRGPPVLPEAFVADFERMLSVHRDAGMRVIPSFVSFEFFQSAIVRRDRVVERGRSAFVFGAEGDGSLVDAFLDATLEPLLSAAALHRRSIYAFEVINEPDWVVEGGPVHFDVPAYGFRPSEQLVSPAAMAILVAAAAQRITRADHVATVGFAREDISWIPTALRAHLLQWAIGGRYLHQVHHYPTCVGPFRLPHARSMPFEPCLLGELPSAMANGLTNVPWLDREVWRTELDRERYLEGRLELARLRGYSGALVWSMRSHDRRASFGFSQRQQLARFARRTR